MYPLLPAPVDETASVPLRRVNWDTTDITTRNATPRHVGQRHAAQQHTAMSLARTLNAEREYLHLVSRDEIAAAVEALDTKIDAERGEMQEYPDRSGLGPTLFRYTGRDGVQSAHSIPVGRLTPHVRALLWELAEAIEDEGRL